MTRDICYFDGHCGVCSRSIRLLRSLDWLGAVTFRDMNATPDDELPVSRAVADTGMPMRTADGRVLVGFAAFRRLWLRLPALAAPALLMYVPGLAQLGAWGYRWFARHRLRFGTVGGTCTVNPGSGGKAPLEPRPRFDDTRS